MGHLLVGQRFVFVLDEMGRDGQFLQEYIFCWPQWRRKKEEVVALRRMVGAEVERRIVVEEFWKQLVEEEVFFAVSEGQQGVHRLL